MNKLAVIFLISLILLPSRALSYAQNYADWMNLEGTLTCDQGLTTVKIYQASVLGISLYNAMHIDTKSASFFAEKGRRSETLLIKLNGFSSISTNHDNWWNELHIFAPNFYNFVKGKLHDCSLN